MTKKYLPKVSKDLSTCPVCWHEGYKITLEPVKDLDLTGLTWYIHEDVDNKTTCYQYTGDLQVWAYVGFQKPSPYSDLAGIEIEYLK